MNIGDPEWSALVFPLTWKAKWPKTIEYSVVPNPTSWDGDHSGEMDGDGLVSYPNPSPAAPAAKD